MFVPRRAAEQKSAISIIRRFILHPVVTKLHGVKIGRLQTQMGHIVLL